MKSNQDLQNLTTAEMAKLSKKLSEALSAKTGSETEIGFDYIYYQALRNKKLLQEELS